MEGKEKVKNNWEKDVLQSLEEQDVIILRKRLRRFQNSGTENTMNYEMKETEDINS